MQAFLKKFAHLYLNFRMKGLLWIAIGYADRKIYGSSTPYIYTRSKNGLFPTVVFCFDL